MNSRIPLALLLLPLPALVTRVSATGYTTGGGDATNGATWTPDASAIIAAGSITPLNGDTLSYTGALSGGNIVINDGASLRQTGGGQIRVSNHIDLAGTGADGQGALQNIGTDWINVSDVRLTDDATVRVASGGWRHNDHGGPVNVMNLNGKTLTVTGANNWYFVNTSLTGGGVMNVNIGGEFNFEASSILPADVTLNLTNTRSSSWDGAGRTMLGNVSLNNSVLENRQNDGGKTYAGTMTLINQGTLRVANANGTSNNFMNVTGQITGSGKLVRDGTAGENVFLYNGANNYTGGTDLLAGNTVLGANNAVSTSNFLNISSGAVLNMNGFNQTMHSGSLVAGSTVSGNGDLTVNSGTLAGAISGGGKVITGPGTVSISPTASITKANGLDLAGGTVRPLGNNVLGNVSGSVTVTENTIIKPENHGLAAYRDGNGLDQGGANDVFNNRPITGLSGQAHTGITDGIVAIDSTAKPHGDFNRFLYTGKLINTTGSDLQVSFGEQYDDQIRVEVDGTTVLLDGGWNSATASSLVSLSPGPHDIRIQSFDGVGGAGPNSGWTKGVGIKIGSHTITDINGGGDNAAFTQINIANLSGMGLDISAGDITESKNIAINTGKSLTVDTSSLVAGNYVLNGVVSGGGGLTKAGAGTAQINGLSTYTGRTLISAGTLKLGSGGSISSSNEITVAAGATLDGSAVSGGVFTIAAGQKLDGNGTVAGNTKVDGTISPGNSIGALTIAGNLTLSGATDMEIDPSASPNSDEIIVISPGTTITYGGTLNVTQIGGTLALGQTFDLFDATTFTGSFTTTNLPSLTGMGDGFWYWKNDLAIDGSLTVLPEPSTGMFVLVAAAGFLRRRR